MTAALFPLPGFETDRLWRAVVVAVPPVPTDDEDWLFWSDVSLACADVIVAWDDSTALCSDVVSRTASA